MLADQWLRHAQRVDQFVDAALGLAQLQHDGDTHRRGQRAQQLTGRFQNFPRRRRGQLGEVRNAVLMRFTQGGADVAVTLG